MIHKGSRVPVPCRGCGKGVQSTIELCQGCGRARVWHRHNVIEAKARKQYEELLKQIRGLNSVRDLVIKYIPARQNG